MSRIFHGNIRVVLRGGPLRSHTHALCCHSLFWRSKVNIILQLLKGNQSFPCSNVYEALNVLNIGVSARLRYFIDFEKQLRSFLIHITLLLTSLAGIAHDSHPPEWVKFQENKGQWGNDLVFYGKAANMDVFVTDGRFMLQLKNQADFDLIHDIHHGLASIPDDMQIRYHNIEFQLINPASTKPFGEKKTEDYVNYFLGNDSSLWAGGVQQFGEVHMPSVYTGIDFLLTSLGDHLKYEFNIAAGADPSLARFKINGVDSIYLFEHKIHLANSVDMLIDDEPIAWQIIEGEKHFVECEYTLTGDTLGFALPDYDRQFPLIIDPTLIFSSFTGSSTDNWGSTATYDSLGNLYAGGIAITTLNGTMNGYPTTTGAFQSTYQGGAGSWPNQPYGTDIVISKFNTSGSSLVYSTYLGGSNNEIPHSLVVNNNNQLYVLGTTSSSNFPISSGAFDGTFNGGSNIGAGTGNNNNSSSVAYPNGSDIIIAKFNLNGTALSACTYIGGTGNDGINLSDTLQKAYSDEFRGEIIVDNNDNCYVATSTGSNDFPIVSGFQTSYGGGLTDGVVFKFNSSLSSLLWSSYIGGSEADAAYSLQFDPSLNIFATGGTKSTNFPTTTGVINPNYKGGTTDGWVAKINSNGQTLMASTFLGTNAYDQSFFVQLDLQGNVYCVGQTLGAYPIGPSWVYSVNNSGQFLHKLSNNLQQTRFSTRWGTGNSAINLSLSAFLVNQCNHIFVAGWGGSLFGTGSITSGNSTTNGLPTTSNAYQTTTDGNDMYFIVFEDSAKAVLFASYFGGSGSGGSEHVDGGTSRFDKKGIIYQAVCAGCGGGNAFPTTSGAYATTNGSNNCNLGAIKYDLVTLEAEADIDGPTEICVNDSIQFLNQSFGGSLYLWDFGDGNFSDKYEPKHAYSNPGNYDVVLVIYDSVSCIFADTDTIEILVIPGPHAQVPNLNPVCPDVPVQLNVSGGLTYQWAPAGSLNNANIANPIATVEMTTTFIVSATDSCGTDTAHLIVKIFPDKTDALDDTALCEGLSGPLWASGGSSYSWNPGIYLSSSTAARPICSPDSTIHYIVTIIDSFQCEREHPVKVYVEGFLPQIKAWGDTTVCPGDRVLLSASGTNGYQWTPTTWVLDPNLPSTPAYPEESIFYVVRTFNSCGEAMDTVRIVVNPIDVLIDPDTAVCFGDSVYLGATGALVYKWTGKEFSLPNYNQYPGILPKESGWYVVRGSNLQGCERIDSLYVQVHSNPTLELLTDEDTITGLSNVILAAKTSAPHRWLSTGYIPCETCDSIKVYPLYETEYFIEVIDSNQCRVLDSISVKAISKIYVPSSFTPNADNFNDLFVVQGHNILKYEISIRDRWGEEMFRSKDIERHWKGSKFNKGNILADGVYSYEIRFTILPEQELVKTGTVTLLK